MVWRAGKPLGARLCRDGFQLLDGGWPVNVARNRQHFLFAFFNEVLGQLGGGGGFTCALQTRHQNDCGGLGRQINVRHAIAHGGRKLSVHNGHQGLAWFERTQDLLSQGLVFHARNEIAHYRQGHIGLEQGHAHFAQHVGHIGFSDPGLPADLLDQLREFVGKSGGHRQNFFINR